MKSMGEVRCAADIINKRKAYEYEGIKLNYIIEASYTPDFIHMLEDGTKLILEYKGKMTVETRRKILAIIKSNPGIRFCIIFERSGNKLSSRPNSMKYWEWANKHNIPNNEKYSKKEWFDINFWKKREKYESYC